jgi:GNAT superfamily N-acetyltransferase
MSARDETRRSAVKIRWATAADLSGMTRVHVDTWKTTYRGIVPDERLDRMTYESDVAAGFGRWITEPPAGQANFVAVTDQGEILGFAVCGPNREADLDFTGELGAIYILKAQQGRGIGTALVREVARHLLSIGRDSMIVWVLAQNPYRRFYERLGGVPVRERTESRLGGPPLPEVGYGWKDIRALAE